MIAPGQAPINTVHRFESKRPQVMDLLEKKLKRAAGIYCLSINRRIIIYGLRKFDERRLKKLKSFFPEPKFWNKHGAWPATSRTKGNQYAALCKRRYNIMVSTTVIEVGVNVPNASVMVIESAENLACHNCINCVAGWQRAEQSFCILLTGNKLSADARERLKILCATNDGFCCGRKGSGDTWPRRYRRDKAKRRS